MSPRADSDRVAYEPGASITRRRKPSDARGGSAERDAPRPPAPAAPPAQILQTRLDALHLRFRGGLLPAVRKSLMVAVETAQQLGGRAVALTIGSCEMAISPKSRDGWWVLENGDLAVTVDEGAHLSGWAMTIKVRAQSLASLGPRLSVELASDLASNMLHLVEGERVAWLDLCADVVGFDVESIDPRQWVGCGQAKARKLTPSAEESRREWFAGGERIAFYVGKGDLVLRVYDKTVELQNDLHGDRRAAEHARWIACGWNRVDRVTRVEFQVRGAAVKELDDGRLLDTLGFIQRLDAVWNYLTTKWVRLCLPDTATRRARWLTDRRWRTIQDAGFGDDQGEVASRLRARGTPAANFVASLALSYAAKSGMLDGVAIPRAAEVRGWDPGRARQWVCATMGAILGSVGDRIAHALLGQHGPVRSAELIAERLSAARARSSTVLASASPVAFDQESAYPSNDLLPAA